ncbi:MAG: methyltransferase domain-containing protein [Candidatus Sericytochromatia bacterium]|nr:methyltransferase domain-containing protein [Candidatus Sericytochromatia bacterium]
MYAGYRDAEYVALREHYEPGYAAVNAVLTKAVRYTDLVEAFLLPHVQLPVDLLDWGGDTGANSPFKQHHRRWDIFDISGAAPVVGARAVSRSEAEQGGYSLVVCSQVLEHVSWPLLVLREMVGVMDEQTVLYVELPHEALIREGARLPEQKRHWHEHVNFFTRRAIEEMVVRVGLEILAFRDDNYVSIGDRRGYLFQVALRKAPA